MSQTPSKSHMKRFALSISLAAGVIALIFVAVIFSHNEKSSIGGGPRDLREHPIYSAYEFPKGKRVISIGVQPLCIFASNISEIMQRDAILHLSLHKMGIDIRFFPFLKGADLNYFVRRGDLDAGMCGDMSTLTLAVSLDIVVPTLVDQGFIDIVATQTMLVRELKGKRIGYALGSDAHYALLEALASEGLTKGSVDLIPMDVNQMPAAITNDEIDACATWEPCTSEIVMEDPRAQVIHRSRYLGFLFFRKDSVDRHREAVKQIIASEIRAIRWMLESRDNLEQSSRWARETIERFIGTRYEFPPERFVDIVSQYAQVNTVPIIPAMDLQKNGHLHREFEFLKTVGELPDNADWERVRAMFDCRIINQVLSNNRHYRLDEFIIGQRE
jgi:sulfonate transport system substrate-binding protein